MVSCRMYRSYLAAVNGFSKSTLGVFNNNVFALLFYLVIFTAGPMIILTTLNLNLVFFMMGLIMLSRVMISLSAGQKVWLNIALHPIQMINLTLIALLSIQRHLTKTNVWKGRRIGL
jgi:hypothetical protein